MKKKKSFPDSLKRFFEIAFLAVVSALFLKIFVVEAFRIPTGSMEKTLLAGDFLLVNKLVYGPSTPRFIPFTNIDIPYFRFPSIEEPQNNDIIIFEFPGELNELEPEVTTNYIKRCVGIPGDSIKIINKKVFVNGKLLPLPENAIADYQNFQREGSVNKKVFPKGFSWNEDNYGPIFIPGKDSTIQLNHRNIFQWEALINREFERKVVQVIDSKVYIDGKQVNSYTFNTDYFFVLGDNRDDSYDSRFWGYVAREEIIGQAIMIYWSWDASVSITDFSKLMSSIRWNRILQFIN